MFNVNYFVNEEKKVVVAKITGTSHDLVCEMEKKGYCGVPLIISNEFVGKAKCSSDDIFDVEKGKKIAFKRAYYRYIKAKKAELKRFSEWLKHDSQEMFNVMNKMSAKYEKSMERRLKEIENVIKE